MEDYSAGWPAGVGVAGVLRFSPRRARLASFAHAYAVAIQRRAAGDGCLLVVATGDPLQPFRVTSAAANDERILARVA